MKKHIYRWLSVLLCVMLLPINALGEYAFVQLGAKIHAQPDEASKAVSSYKAGTWVAIEDDYSNGDEDTQEFLYVTGTDGLSGYISVNDVFVESMANPAEVAVVANGGKFVNLRSDASKTASVLAKVNSGTPMILNAVGGSFDEVTVGGVHGYMAKGLLKTGLKPIYSPYIVSSNGKSVNLRAEPSANAEIVTHMAYGSKVNVHILGGGWAKVAYKSYTGYVMSKFLAANLPPAPNPNPVEPTNFRSVELTGYVSNRGASVRYRSGPSMDSAVLGKVNSGAEIYVSETNGEWDKVFLGAGGSAVYIMSRYIVFINPINPDDPFIPVPNPNPDDDDPVPYFEAFDFVAD